MKVKVKVKVTNFNVKVVREVTLPTAGGDCKIRGGITKFWVPFMEGITKLWVPFPGRGLQT